MFDVRFTDALTGTTVGTYALVALGATTAATDTVDTIAMLHHAVAVVVGLAVALVGWLVWRETHPARVRGAVSTAALLYPLQAAIGAATYAGAPLGTLHLLAAMGIFAALLAALVWHLDSRPLDHSLDRPERERSGESTVGDGPLSTVRAYVRLTKPRLTWLLCLLALAGMGLAAASGAAVTGTAVAATLGGGILAVGAAGTFNHLYERDRDRRMDRTSDRPLATDRVSTTGAALFGVGLSLASLTVVWVFTTPLAAALTATAIVYYAGLYTVVLKPNTTWSIAIGGGSGALPAVIGWAAVTGGIGLPAVALAGVVVIWTPGHFYNLGIAYRDDYAAADYPMLPVVRGNATARRRIGFALGGTLLAAAGLGAVADLGALYAVALVVGAAVFLASVVAQYRERTYAATMRSFHASNAFLGVLLVAIVVETLLL